MLREQPRRRARPSAPPATSAPLALLTPPKERPLTLPRAALRSTAGTPRRTAPLARRPPHPPSRGTTVSRTRTATTIRTFVRGECIECSHLTMLIFVDAVLFVFRAYFFLTAPLPSYLNLFRSLFLKQVCDVSRGVLVRGRSKNSVSRRILRRYYRNPGLDVHRCLHRGVRQLCYVLYSTPTVCFNSVWFTLISNFPPLFRLPSQILLPSRLVVSHRQGVR